MAAYRKNTLWRIIILALSSATLACMLSTIFAIPPNIHAAPAKLPHDITANGPYTVKGNKVLGANGQPYVIRGIARGGLEYDCKGVGPLDKQSLALMGSSTGRDVGTYWGANTIRLPLSENFWLYGDPEHSCSAEQYRKLVKRIVDDVTSLKLNVMLDLHWANAGGQSKRGGGPTAMPDADSVIFWHQIATLYRGYSNVFFELFNEPHPYHPGTNMWECWRSGCKIVNDKVYAQDCNCTRSFTYQSVGMQKLIDTVRATGAKNPVIVAGMNWGYELSQIPKYPLKGGNIIYDTHPYPYEGKKPADWDRSFGNLAATYPIISAENGQYDCGSDFMRELLNYLDARQMGWVAWAWIDVSSGEGCGYPQLVTDYYGTPSKEMGLYIYQHFRKYNPR